MIIDLNCDMGESFGPWPIGNDAAQMQHSNSTNIACGFHDCAPVNRQRTDRLARELRAAGKDVEYFPYINQPHWFTGSSNTTFLERVVKFFDRHLKSGS